MTEDLLAYYNRELAFLRRMGAEFAKAHPKVAGRMRLGSDTVEDPHVARLIESAAFLNARIRHKLDDEFPELTDALLGVLYPHYLAPIPSMAIVQLEPAPDLTEAQTVPEGTTVETDRAHGEPCRYRTCYPTTLVPLAVVQAQLAPAPFEAPRTAHSSTSVAVLRLTLRTTVDKLPMAGVLPGRLRFFLAGQIQHAQALYELLLNDVVELAVASSPNDRRPRVLPKTCIHPVGFGIDEGLLPYPKRSFPGYRLLTEYFAFPSKFLFVEFEGLDRALGEKTQNELTLYVFLRRSSVDLQKNVGPSTFALGCTPIVNLFAKRAEPIRLTQREPEVRVVPDARRPQAVEIYSIDKVSLASSSGAQTECKAYYGIDHGGMHDAGGAPWYHAVRRPAETLGTRTDRGTEVHLRLVDGRLEPLPASDAVMMVETTCLNRDLPASLPFGGDQPRMALVGGVAPVKRVRCLTAPTATLRPERGAGAQWRLVSHLALNSLSLSGDDEGTQALREILRLYDGVRSESSRSIIDSVRKVERRLVTMRVQSREPSGVQAAFCRGTEVVLHLDEQRFADHGLFLFASVLEAFLGLYCSVNSFVQTVLRTNGREGELRRWPARAGSGPIL